MTTPHPSTATEVRREDDDELLGFTAPTGSGWQALTVFGGLLGEHPSADAAAAQLRAEGLASLADRWWIETAAGWERCHLIEASPERVVVVVAPYAWMGEPQVVAGHRLRRTPPG